MAERITDERLDAWERLTQEVTRGKRLEVEEWDDPELELANVVIDDEIREVLVLSVEYELARWIAECGEAAPALIAEVRKLRDLIRRMANELDDSVPLWQEIYDALGLEWPKPWPWD